MKSLKKKEGREITQINGVSTNRRNLRRSSTHLLREYLKIGSPRPLLRSVLAETLKVQETTVKRSMKGTLYRTPRKDVTLTTLFYARGHLERPRSDPTKVSSWDRDLDSSRKPPRGRRPSTTTHSPVPPHDTVVNLQDRGEFHRLYLTGPNSTRRSVYGLLSDCPFIDTVRRFTALLKTVKNIITWEKNSEPRTSRPSTEKVTRHYERVSLTLRHLTNKSLRLSPVLYCKRRTMMDRQRPVQ